MRIVLLIADLLAALGIVVLILGGARVTAPVESSIIGILFSVVGLVLGVATRFFIGRGRGRGKRERGG